MKYYLVVEVDPHVDDTYHLHESLQGANEAVERWKEEYIQYRPDIEFFEKQAKGWIRHIDTTYEEVCLYIEEVELES